MGARRPLAVALAVGALIGFAGCGDEEGSTTTAPSTTNSSTRTSPTSTSTSTSTSTQSTSSSTSTTSTVTESTGVTTTTPAYDPDQPDSEANDRPPKPGSPEEAFEQACEADPEACG